MTHHIKSIIFYGISIFVILICISSTEINCQLLAQSRRDVSPQYNIESIEAAIKFLQEIEARHGQSARPR